MTFLAIYLFLAVLMLVVGIVELMGEGFDYRELLSLLLRCVLWPLLLVVAVPVLIWALVDWIQHHEETT